MNHSLVLRRDAERKRVAAQTRDVIIRFREHARTRSAIGRNRLAGWPTKF